MTTARVAITIAASAVAGLMLTGCAGAQSALDQAQGVVDQTQSLVDSASSLASAPEAISAACATAIDGTAPDVPVDQARAAVTAATQQLDEALGIAGALPIVSEVRDVLVSSAESLVADGSAAGIAAAREAISGVCRITQQ